MQFPVQKSRCILNEILQNTFEYLPAVGNANPAVIHKNRFYGFDVIQTRQATRV